MTTPAAVETHRLACLADWVVEYCGGDPRAIGAYLDRIERPDGPPIGRVPGLRALVREAYRRRVAAPDDET